MKKTFILMWGSLLYMELVYHFSCFGFVEYNPFLMVTSTLIWAGFGTMLTGFVRKKTNKVILWILQILGFLLFASQIVYLMIFKQPLLFAAVRNAGGMALKTYWRETLVGILSVSGYLMKADYYDEYREFYDPLASMEQFGVVASLQRDLTGGIIPREDFVVESWTDMEEIEAVADKLVEDKPQGESPLADVPEDDNSMTSKIDNNTVSGSDIIEKESLAKGDGAGSVDTETAEKPAEEGDNVLPIDFEKLLAISDTKDVQKLTDYIQTLEPTEKNEYTGMFEGYNLIYLTAEGFCPYAVDETLTPTLYKLTNSGFVAKDYYVPLWQTSTSDGEYVNLTGLIPDQQFSMKRSAVNEQPFSLAAYFNREGATSYAFHNNTLSYYERHLSHPNLGYIFKASKLGELTEEEWGSSIFPMEDVDDWPSSDLNMMKATIPEYINDERFHVYYMTVSGHMNYNFTGNQMSRKNKAAVEKLPYSEEGQAYIACNIELDKALEYLIDELDKVGKLEETVICLSADHYPYAMNVESLEELAGQPLEGTLDIYRNSLILWNSRMETVKIDKACSALDLMPTLLNLFGFPYDSRLFAGHDILSDSLPMVVFSDRSFITDKISYYKKDRSVTPLTEAVTDEAYLDAMRTVVKNMNNFSGRVLNNNYYSYITQCLPEDWHTGAD